MSLYRFLFVGLLLISGLSINSQALAQSEIEEAELPSSDTRPFRFGVRVGYAQSKYYSDTSSRSIETEWVQSPTGALTFAYLWGDDYRSQFWLQVEAAYRLAGVKRRGRSGPERPQAEDETYSFEYEEMLHQVGVPILFRVKIGADKVKPFISVGPYIGFNFMSKSRLQSTTTNRPTLFDEEGNRVPDVDDVVPGAFLFDEVVETVDEENDLDDVNPIEAGMILDAGLSFPINDMMNLKLSARYNLGLTRIYNENLQANNRNQTMQISLGVEF